MTGKEYKFIRRWNGISQKQICEIVGWKNTHAAWELECQKLIPDRFVLILSKLIGINLLDEELFQKALEKAKRGLKLKREYREFRVW